MELWPVHNYCGILRLGIVRIQQLDQFQGQHGSQFNKNSLNMDSEVNSIVNWGPKFILHQHLKWKWYIYNMASFSQKHLNDVYGFMPKWKRVGRSVFFLFKNRYYTDKISHWGPFGLARRYIAFKSILYEHTLIKSLWKYAWAWRPAPTPCFVFYMVFSDFFFWGGGLKN